MSENESSFDNPRVFFAASLFHAALDEHRAAFLSLHELIDDDDVVAVYLANCEKKVNKDTKYDEKFYHHLKRAVRASRNADILVAREISNRQAIVVAATFTESMLQEFFHCVFGKYPLRMYEFLPDNNSISEKGKIDLKDLVESSSKGDLLYSLAERSASAALQGSFPTIVKSLQRITKNAIDTNLLEEIVRINEIRNKIVHELSEERISIGVVETAFETTLRLVRHLEQVAIKLNIPVLSIGANREDSLREDKV